MNKYLFVIFIGFLLIFNQFQSSFISKKFSKNTHPNKLIKIEHHNEASIIKPSIELSNNIKVEPTIENNESQITNDDRKENEDIDFKANQFCEAFKDGQPVIDYNECYTKKRDELELDAQSAETALADYKDLDTKQK